MLHYLTAAGLIAHTVFWGLGLAWLVVPRIWRHWWWALAPGLGVALQSAVVWVGAHTSLPGTNSYALASELIPLALLALAARSGWPRVRPHLQRARVAVGWIAIAVVGGWALLWPLAQRGAWTLTAASLGSCDHADYAAGTRVFQEFSRDDRTGFLGLPEVTQVGSADNFFDVCLRLNHFTPSALLAHHGAVFGFQSHQLINVTAVALVLMNAALVAMLGRVALGFRGWRAWLPVALYVLSPVGAYAVYQAALGQLYGAQGIALLTLAVIGARRFGRSGRWPWPWAPLMLAGTWILAGSYNFILTVALSPALAWLLVDALRRRDWRGPLRVVGVVLAALVACAALFWGRFDGLIERFQLFEKYNFGWPMPVLSPEGWLGLVRDPALHAWPFPVRIVLAGLVTLAALVALAMLWRNRRASVLAAAALTLPVLAGWALLVWESRIRANASYDAYKLLSVFFPGLLIGVMPWLAVRGRSLQRALLAVGLGLVAANGWVQWQFARQMAVPPLRVDRTLLELRRLDRMPRVTSINMRIEDFWSRLWANAFLLRKPQYFSVHTYEGRLNTSLKGEWNLSDSLLRSRPLREADHIEINPVFHAVRVGSPGEVDLAFGSGWHDLERLGPNRWRWASGPATIGIHNPSGHPMNAMLSLRVRSVEKCRLQLELGDARVGTSRPLNGNIQDLEYRNVVLPPGPSVLILQTDRPPARASVDDARPLAVALYGLTVVAEP